MSERYRRGLPHQLPDIPGVWVADADVVVLTATDGDGPTVDGLPFVGEVRFAAGLGAEAESRVAVGEKRLVVPVREGVWGVRVFDPEPAGRRAFRGIEATPYDPRWAVPGTFTPYGDTRTVRVGNADGRERGACPRRRTRLHPGRAGAGASGRAAG